MNTTKQAQRDAHEYARAAMAYGEGAGTRRKLIENTVMARGMHDDAYARAFDRALASEDMSTHAAQARKEQRRKDTTKKLDRNVRGLATGRYENLDTLVLASVAALYVAHRAGYLQQARDRVTGFVADVKQARRSRRDGIATVTTLRNNT